MSSKYSYKEKVFQYNAAVLNLYSSGSTIKISSRIQDNIPCTKSKKIFQQESYHLCRCGNSENKPFCDGTHLKNLNN